MQHTQEVLDTLAGRLQDRAYNECDEGDPERRMLLIIATEIWASLAEHKPPHAQDQPDGVR